jgi:hypothetical protein
MMVKFKIRYTDRYNGYYRVETDILTDAIETFNRIKQRKSVYEIWVIFNHKAYSTVDELRKAVDEENQMEVLLLTIILQ